MKKILFLFFIAQLSNSKAMASIDNEMEFLQTQGQNIKLKLPGQTIVQDNEQDTILSDEVSTGNAGIMKKNTNQQEIGAELPDYQWPTQAQSESFRPARKRSR